MSQKSSYQNYVTDEQFLSDYNSYQAKYAANIRESDKVMLAILRDVIAKYEKKDKPLRLLDVGCSTGNLLLHLKYHFPELDLTGGDLAISSLEDCRANPKLQGITFAEIDMLNIPATKPYDIIIANAVAVYFFWHEYKSAMQSVYNALAPKGVYMAFEWLHPFIHQDIVINETPISHPDGIRICFRPMQKTEMVLRDAGFAEVQFKPFEMPFDLPESDPSGEVVSFTRTTGNGERLCFRGALSQPWCHLVAKKV